MLVVTQQVSFYDVLDTQHLHVDADTADTHQVSRFFSLASLSYFSKVLLSTMPVRYLWCMRGTCQRHDVMKQLYSPNEKRRLLLT